MRLALEAQRLAEERSYQAAVVAERQAYADEAARLRREAEKAKVEAERSQQRASEEERQRRDAEERARLEQDRARQEQERAQQLAAAKSEAELAAERAKLESQQTRSQMQQALSRVVETRETARGLILNLPDILFDFNKATLRPRAREVLSKIAGILLVAQGFRLSIEGHTDNIGRREYNQELSERRAQSVRDYLVQAGVSANIITTRGLADSQPITDNRTEAGRQKNRRVEIVIENTSEFMYKP